MVALVGKSGSGKSTLLNLLSGNETPTSGTVHFGGKNLAKLKKNELELIRNQHFGFVYQYFNLIESLSVKENIAMPLLIAGESKKNAFKEAQRLLCLFNLKGLEERNVKTLSGGEKQRVALLRAIIKKPSVIFADEPTGALDEKHGVEVMETLKELSKIKLVILVSHNENLVQQYTDFIIRLENGMVVESNLQPTIIKNDIGVERNKTKNHWKMLLLTKHLRNNMAKNLFTVVSSAIGFLTLIISVGFFNGSRQMAENETKKVLTRYVAGISKKETVELKDSPLSLTKVSRPSIEEVRNIVSENIYIGYDFSYFFPAKNNVSVKDENIEVNLVPIVPKKCSVYQELLVNTSIDDLSGDECYINNEFLSVFNCNVSDTISVKYDITTLVDNSKEIVSIEKVFKITGVVSEFSFLNEPRMYYDYDEISSYFSNYSIGDHQTIYQLVENSEPTSSLSNFQMKLFALNDDGAVELEKLQHLEGWSLSSNYVNIKESFVGLQKALTTSLVPFAILELLMILFVGGFVSFSTFLDQKKEAAILNSLGAKRSALSNLYVTEAMCLSVAGTILAIFLSLAFQYMLNGYLFQKLNLANLIKIPYGFIFIILIVLISAGIGYLGTKLPLKIMNKYPLSEALREE